MWNFEKYGGNLAVRDDRGVELTYQELKWTGDEIASVVGERCLVFSLCQNTAGSIAGYAGFVNHRIVPVLLSAHIDREMLQALMDAYAPSFLWIPSEKKGEFGGAECVYEKYEYCLLRTDFASNYALNDLLCLMLTTSGSTGSPKFVRQSYQNVLSNAEAIVEYLALGETERPITTLPMNYTYGLSIVNSHFLVGATLYATDKTLMQKEFWNFFRESGTTSFGGVPYTYEMLDKLRFYRMDLPTLRYMTQAGGKLTPELHRKFAEYAEKTGKKFVVMYGQCEATARMGYLPAEKSLEKCGSMGIAISHGKFRLVDVNGVDIHAPNVTGELVYEGPNVTLGYAESGDDLIRGDERHGILQTGDMALFDEDGYYYIVGRKKRFLKIYGNRVGLDEMERLIRAAFDCEVACTGIDDHLYIFLTDRMLENPVRDFAIEKTKLNPVAFQTRIIAEIPRNDSGKIVYKDLTKYFE